MTQVSIEDRRGRRWFVITPSRLVIDALVLGSVGVAIGSLLLTSHRGPAWPALGIVLLALFAMILPDSWAAMGAMVAYGTWWLHAVDDVTTPWVVPAAVALLVFHAAVSHASSGPAGIASDRATARAWWRSAVLVSAPTVLVFGVVTLARDAGTTPPAIVGLTLLLVILLLLLTGRRADPSEGDAPL
jgi:hypothetical protein